MATKIKREHLNPKLVRMRLSEALLIHTNLALVHLASERSLHDFQVSIDLAERGNFEEIQHRTKTLIQPMVKEADMARLANAIFEVVNSVFQEPFRMLPIAVRIQTIDYFAEQIKDFARQHYAGSGGDKLLEKQDEKTNSDNGILPGGNLPDDAVDGERPR